MLVGVISAAPVTFDIILCNSVRDSQIRWKYYDADLQIDANRFKMNSFQRIFLPIFVFNPKHAWLRLMISTIYNMANVSPPPAPHSLRSFLIKEHPSSSVETGDASCSARDLTLIRLPSPQHFSLYDPKFNFSRCC